LEWTVVKRSNNHWGFLQDCREELDAGQRFSFSRGMSRTARKNQNLGNIIEIDVHHESYECGIHYVELMPRASLRQVLYYGRTKKLTKYMSCEEEGVSTSCSTSRPHAQVAEGSEFFIGRTQEKDIPCFPQVRLK
jgi:hypothetical protein